MENKVSVEHDSRGEPIVKIEGDFDKLNEKLKKKLMDNIIWHANQIKSNPSWNNATIRDIIGHFSNVIKQNK
jgi:hypothetical protein